MLFRGNKKIEPQELHKLDEFGIAFMETDGKIKEMIKKKDTNEIRKILETVKRLEKDNCWNAVYRVREFIKNAGIEELKARVPQIKIPEVREQADTEVTEEEMEKIDTKEEKEIEESLQQ